MKILSTYEAVSGQRINPQKSAITFSAKTPPEVRARVKEAMAIEAEGGGVSGSTLGFPRTLAERREIFSLLL